MFDGFGPNNLTDSGRSTVGIHLPVTGAEGTLPSGVITVEREYSTLVILLKSSRPGTRRKEYGRSQDIGHGNGRHHRHRRC